MGGDVREHVRQQDRLLGREHGHEQGGHQWYEQWRQQEGQQQEDDDFKDDCFIGHILEIAAPDQPPRRHAGNRVSDRRAYLEKVRTEEKNAS
jgi:hypothetical protein